MILSTAMMFEFAFEQKDISELIVKSVDNVINSGLRTKDISQKSQWCKTFEMGDSIASQIRSII